MMLGINTGSEELWAEHGLTGLVLFALFGLIAVIIKLFVNYIQKKDTHIEKILEDERTERQIQREEHTKVYNGLAGSIDHMTETMKNMNDSLRDARIKQEET